MAQKKNSDQQPDARRTTSFFKRIFRRIVLVSVIAILGLFGLRVSSQRPDDLGLIQGKLRECPTSPNAVSTQTNSPEHQMSPLAYEGSAADAVEKLKDRIAKKFSSAKLITETDNYLHYEFTSLFFRFVDDVELYIDDQNKLIHFRSASRIGHSDLGANRRRMNQITMEFQK